MSFYSIYSKSNLPEIIEPNSLIEGDCLEIMCNIPDKSVDMVMADLPYGITKNKWDSVIPIDQLWLQYKRIVRTDGAIILTASQPFTSILVISNTSNFKYCWVWEKGNATGHLNAKRMPMKLHEDIVVFSNGGTIKYTPQGLDSYGKVTKRGGNGSNFSDSGKENFQEYTNYPRSILRYPSDKQKLHPTQKPIALMEYLIKTYTNEGEVVLDNTMGSGTTGVACNNVNRKFIGIEMDRKYFEIAVSRVTNNNN